MSLPKKHGIKNIFTSLEEMLTGDVIHAVYIASPNGAHALQAVKVAATGKTYFM